MFGTDATPVGGNGSFAFFPLVNAGIARPGRWRRCPAFHREIAELSGGGVAFAYAGDVGQHHPRPVC